MRSELFYAKHYLMKYVNTDPEFVVWGRVGIFSVRLDTNYRF